MTPKLRGMLSITSILLLLIAAYFAGRYHEAYRASHWRVGRVATLLQARDTDPERLSTELDQEARAEVAQANLLSSHPFMYLYAYTFTRLGSRLPPQSVYEEFLAKLNLVTAETKTNAP